MTPNCFCFQDFWENIVHHISTIIMLIFSYVGNFLKIGALVMVTHDAVDWWMEVSLKWGNSFYMSF